ncbi:MAG: band 7 protein [Bacteroides sp. 43_108]|nr:MAG: band 7 protein [Bacteroides sp. 43_108]
MEKKEFEYVGFTANGFIALFLNLALMALSIFCFFLSDYLSFWAYVAGGVGLLASFVIWGGMMQLEPNEARAMVFFGTYKGTFKRTGLFWVNPFMEAKKISLRARNLNVDPIKVNDKEGNPILIGLVLVWKLKDTYCALFEIDSQTMASKPNEAGTSLASRMRAFEDFVRVQSDAALRQVAGLYAYDNNEGGNSELTLRNSGNEINEELERKLNERLDMAGMEVVEARINYLAYAPEIAAVMLRRQQASAILSAREKIVDGAVSMVKMAIDKLENENVVKLSDDKRASVVSNLLVVLCADEPAQPVINSGAQQ